MKAASADTTERGNDKQDKIFPILELCTSDYIFTCYHVDPEKKWLYSTLGKRRPLVQESKHDLF